MLLGSWLVFYLSFQSLRLGIESQNHSLALLTSANSVIDYPSELVIVKNLSTALAAHVAPRTADHHHTSVKHTNSATGFIQSDQEGNNNDNTETGGQANKIKDPLLLFDLVINNNSSRGSEKETACRIILMDRVTKHHRGSRYRIQINNVQSDVNNEYVVHAELAGKFTGTALQTTFGQDPIEFELELPDTGANDDDYSILCYGYKMQVEANGDITFDQWPIQPFPLILSREGVSATTSNDDTSQSDAASTAEVKKDPSPSSVIVPPPPPPCQSLQRHDALVSWNGHWIGPYAELDSQFATYRHGVLPRMRTGWTYLAEKCRLETFTKEEILAISMGHGTTDAFDSTLGKAPGNHSTIIAVLGTSRERGVFLAMVDMALEGAEKQHLNESRVGKCWGRATVELNDHLKLIYQDVRTERCDPMEVPGTIICNNDKRAASSGMLLNTTAMVKKLFEDPHARPQVILLWSGCGIKPFQEVYQKGKAAAKTSLKNNGNKASLGGMVSSVEPTDNCMVATANITAALPSDWNGTVYVTSAFIKADGPELNRNRLRGYRYGLKWFSDYLNDTRIRLLDLHWASDMRFYAEKVGIIRGSTHHHRWCKEDEKGLTIDNNDMRVCGNVTELLANLLIGRAVAPIGKEHWQETWSPPSVDSIPPSRVVKVCSDCPKSFLPMHVKPIPNVTCNVGPMRIDEPTGPSWEAPDCPKECLEKDPVSQQKTQSGYVAVRVCSGLA